MPSSSLHPLATTATPSLSLPQVRTLPLADLAEVGQVLYRLDAENTIVVQAHHTSRYAFDPPPHVFSPCLMYVVVHLYLDTYIHVYINIYMQPAE